MGRSVAGSISCLRGQATKPIHWQTAYSLLVADCPIVAQKKSNEFGICKYVFLLVKKGLSFKSSGNIIRISKPFSQLSFAKKA
jgi:hypothetical protein